MLRKSSRKLLKQALWWSRIKLLYTRATLNRFTTIYVAIAVISCIVFSSLQAVAYHDNSAATDIISSILSKANLTGVTFFDDGALRFCDSIPGESAQCSEIIAGNSTSNEMRAVVSLVGRRSFDAVPILDINDQTIAVEIATGDILTIPCLQSLLWLRDLLDDARREDIVTLSFQLWMFTLSMVTILNESIPHLGASLAGHILGTAWAGFRVSNSKTLQKRYSEWIVEGTCDRIDLLGGWWNMRTDHTIPIIVLNIMAMFILVYISLNLYKVYANQSFTRVGASAEVNKFYKMVLLLSVALQLVGFFSLAATGMWLDKISRSNLRPFAEHLSLYLTAFAVTAVLIFPWVILGWISVRREYCKMFLVFSLISLFLVVISSLMFASPLYRFIFMCWPFFATMTVTSYILLIAAVVLSVLCRVHFGKGLAQYLAVSDALEGMDFTPVNFPKHSDGSIRKFSMDDSNDEKNLTETLEEPQKPTPIHQHAPVRGMHSLSIYSDSARPTMKLSTTPPVAQSIMSRLSVSTSATGYTSSTVSSEPSLIKGSWKQQPLMPAVPISRTPARSSPSEHSATIPVRGLPSNPRPGSPVNVRTVQSQPSNYGYF